MSISRYPKYKESSIEWLGGIPDHWDIKPLYGAVVERSESNAGMIENNLLSLSYGKIIQKDINSNDGLLPESFETYQIVRPGDIVFRLTDLQNDKRSLRSAIVEETGIITSAYVAITPQGPDAKYMGYLFRAYDTTKVFYSMGGGLRQSMKFDDLKRMPTLLPPRSEQTRIASFLDHETAKIDALISEQQRLIDLLKEKRQAVISHAVTKGLNPDVPMKSSGIEWLGEVPKHWRSIPIKRVSSFITSGPRGWSERVSEKGALFVQSGDLNDTLDISFSESKRVVIENGAESARTRLNEGDVVVCITGAKTGNVAVCAKIPEPSYINQHLCLIRTAPEILPRYLGALLKSDFGQTYFDNVQYGLKQGLSLEDVRNAFVLIPPIDEQTEIIDYIDKNSKEIDNLITGSQRIIDLLSERRSALISAAVTGKIDVRGLAIAAVA